MLHISFLRLSFLTPPGTSGRKYPFSLPSLLSGYSGYLATHSFQAMTSLMSQPDKVRCFSHLASFGVYVSYLSYPLISYFGLEALYLIKIFNTQVPVVFAEEFVLFYFAR